MVDLMSNSWEEAVELFLSDWKKRNEVIGALVCGSYITGNPSKHSDIDIHIVLSDKLSWRERGNKYINGFLIEYFANPPKQIKKYFEEDYKDNSHQSHIQFVTGRIVFDKNNEILKLKQLATKYLNKRFKQLNNTQLELKKYSLWDNLDNLEDNYEKNNPDFYYIYFNNLRQIYETYGKSLGVSISNVDKVYKLLMDKETMKKYLEKDFPDSKFVALFLEALNLNAKDKMLNNFKVLTEYVLEAMGGFKINGWKLKSKVEQ